MKKTTTQSEFDTTLRKKADNQLAEAKKIAKTIDWEAAYKVQKEETNEVYRKSRYWNEMYHTQNEANSKLARIIGWMFIIILVLMYVRLQ